MLLHCMSGFGKINFLFLKIMKCPFCSHPDLKVIDSRDSPEINAIRRRRECLKCLRRFTTFETIELTLQIRKRDGCYEDFQKQKLIDGMDAACRHTTISHDQVVIMANKITSELMQKQVHEISTKELGNMVMQYLQALDPIAYIRFACVYNRFKNIGQLMEAIQLIQPKDAITAFKEINEDFSERKAENLNNEEKTDGA
jgi:transcriptional repressor NrdR